MRLGPDEITIGGILPEQCEKCVVPATHAVRIEIHRMILIEGKYCEEHAKDD